MVERVAIVDDSILIREGIAQVLRASGVEPMVLRDSAEYGPSLLPTARASAPLTESEPH